jgi:hypothetical protein
MKKPPGARQGHGRCIAVGVPVKGPAAADSKVHTARSLQGPRGEEPAFGRVGGLR